MPTKFQALNIHAYINVCQLLSELMERPATQQDLNRMAICMMGAISAAANFSTTCCAPKIMHKIIIRPDACASSALRCSTRFTRQYDR